LLPGGRARAISAEGVLLDQAPVDRAVGLAAMTVIDRASQASAARPNLTLTTSGLACAGTRLLIPRRLLLAGGAAGTRAWCARD
jgi:hypothetical protein